MKGILPVIALGAPVMGRRFVNATGNGTFALSTDFAPTPGAGASLNASLSDDGYLRCGRGAKCPEQAPCCNQYGLCNALGPACLGGCDPRFSFTPEACMAMPSCVSHHIDSTQTQHFMHWQQWNGDPQMSLYTYTGFLKDGLVLAMPSGTPGTVLSSSRYILYGTISATLRSARGAGVVSAMLLFSDIHDEVDFEFVGNDLGHVQSNYFFQGDLDGYSRGGKHPVGDTTDWHTYELQWEPEVLHWKVDGKIVRSLYRSDTWDGTKFRYPQTPCRVQLSVWPAGIESSSPGTVEWAGGMVEWGTHPDILEKGYISMEIKELHVDCNGGYNPSPHTSFVYNHTGDYLESSVIKSDTPYILRHPARWKQHNSGPKESGTGSIHTRWIVPYSCVVVLVLATQYLI